MCKHPWEGKEVTKKKKKNSKPGASAVISDKLVTVSKLMANHFEGFERQGWDSGNVRVAVIKDCSLQTRGIMKWGPQVEQIV